MPLATIGDDGGPIEDKMLFTVVVVQFTRHIYLAFEGRNGLKGI